MKRSEVYREAARLLEAGEYTYNWSCWTICQAKGVPFYNFGEPKPAEVDDYEITFSPYNENADSHTRHCWGRAWDEDERRDCRILALCFMAAIAEDEERGAI